MGHKHTPRPWLLTQEPLSGTFHIGVRVDNWRVRVIAVTAPSEDNDSQEQAANARLIAAAPDLLEALQSIADCCNEDHTARYYVSRQAEIRGIARAAIAKATGA